MMRRCVYALMYVLFPVVASAQWLDAKTQAHLKSFWPNSVEFPVGAKFYHLPQAYQNGGAVHSPKYNIAALPDPFGNANLEFPWGFPAGTHTATGWSSYKVALIPGAIRYWRERQKTDFADPVYVTNWAYPDGTTFGEMLLVKDSDGNDRCFEVRIRHKQGGKWESTAFRPIASKDDLPSGAKLVTRTITSQTARAAKSGQQMHVGTALAAFGKERFDVELWDVGPLSNDVLSRPFKPSRIMYTTDYVNSVTPRGYLSNVTSCVACHEQVLTHVSQIDQKTNGRAREWYGSTRGADQNYSFHIFDPSCISDNGYNRPVRLNANLNLEQGK